MNIVVRRNFSSKLKKSTSEIGYYSYTNRYAQLEKTKIVLKGKATAQIALLVFCRHESQRKKNQKSNFLPTLTVKRKFYLSKQPKNRI